MSDNSILDDSDWTRALKGWRKDWRALLKKVKEEKGAMVLSDVIIDYSLKIHLIDFLKIHLIDFLKFHLIDFLNFHLIDFFKIPFDWLLEILFDCRLMVMAGQSR